jgi:hypothetical protein
MAPGTVANADGTFTMAGIAPGRYRFRGHSERAFVVDNVGDDRRSRVA